MAEHHNKRIFYYQPTIWDTKIRIEDVSNVLINNEYRKFKNKVYEDTSLDSLVIWVRSENKNQDKHGRAYFKP